MFTSLDCQCRHPVHTQYTLALIKPDAYGRAEEILNVIHDEGFDVLASRDVRLTPEQAADFYHKQYGRERFPRLVLHAASGCTRALVLARENAVWEWQRLIGPTNVLEALACAPWSVRARFGRREHAEVANAVHGSDSPEHAHHEIRFFFPNMVMVRPETQPLEEFRFDERLQTSLLAGLRQALQGKSRALLRSVAEALLLRHPHTQHDAHADAHADTHADTHADRDDPCEIQIP